MTRAQIHSTDEQLKKLRRLAEREETSVSDVVRRAVDALIAVTPSRSELRERALAATELYASGEHDVAAEHDRHLATAFRS